MPDEAQGPETLEVAFASAFDDGDDVVGIPEAFSAYAFESPAGQELDAVGAAGALEIEVGGAGVDGAEGANAFRT